MLDWALEQGQPGVDHADVVSDDIPRLVLVEEEPPPGVGPDGDVGEQIAGLEVSGRNKSENCRTR